MTRNETAISVSTGRGGFSGPPRQALVARNGRPMWQRWSMAEHEEQSPAADRPSSPTTPAGDTYDWYRRGLGLLESGDAAAAAQLLAHAEAEEPESASIREALARALFDARRYDEAAVAFGRLVGAHPGDDYARFGLGLSLARLRRFEEAVEHLALAAAMRPDRSEYRQALRDARATLRFRDARSDES